jgi:hypothetical protein
MMNEICYFVCADVSPSAADLRPQVGHSAASLRVPEELAQGQLVPARSDAGRDAYISDIFAFGMIVYSFKPTARTAWSTST